jgi:hypothetical protein
VVPLSQPRPVQQKGERDDRYKVLIPSDVAWFLIKMTLRCEVIMASAAANSALGTEVLSVQRLYYGINPNPAAGVFLLFSSQMLGYGLGGLMRCESLSV